MKTNDIIKILVAIAALIGAIFVWGYLLLFLPLIYLIIKNLPLFYRSLRFERWQLVIMSYLIFPLSIILLVYLSYLEYYFLNFNSLIYVIFILFNSIYCAAYYYFLTQLFYQRRRSYAQRLHQKRKRQEEGAR